MPITYTTRVKLGSLANRRRAIEGLCSLLQHAEKFDAWPVGPNAVSVNVADGTISVTLTRALPQAQLEHLGLNDDGVDS